MLCRFNVTKVLRKYCCVRGLCKMSAITIQQVDIPNKNEISDVKTSTEPRRSSRNLPTHLKEKVVLQSQVEKEPDISTLPPIVFNGHINFTNDFHNCAMICDEILKEVEQCPDEIVPIGFDLEWPFNFQTGSGKTALAQICLSNTTCYLLHLYEFKKLPASFVLLLTHPKVRLVGVNIKNDIWKLGRDFKTFPASQVVQNNCLDSGYFANRVLDRSCRWSLLKLTAYVLRKKISKNPEVRNSKWHIQPLSKAQMEYAATDAYVSLLLHTSLQKRADLLRDVKQEKTGEKDHNLDTVLKEKYQLRQLSVPLKKYIV